MNEINKSVTKLKRKILYLCMFFTFVCCICLNEVNAKYNMTYLYGTGDYISLVDNAKGTLDEVSPSYFDITETGNLKLNYVDKTFVNNMHEKGIKVVPFLSNHWNREQGRQALKNRELLSNEIVKAIRDNNLDGVNIDIENVTEIDKESYTEFVKLLKNKVGNEKSIVVSVAANPYEIGNGWQGSYDYEELSKYADYIMIMAYDEHYEAGEAGSVASIEFARKSIEYAMKYVEKSKIVLGIPLYGRYWKDGSNYGGEAISLKKVTELLSKYQNKTIYDENTKTMKSIITIKENDMKPRISGKTWTSGTYIVWYENNDTISEKLKLINEYDIKGAGTWRLGLENSDIWNVFKNYLKSNENVKDNEKAEISESQYFIDVVENHWAYEAVKTMKDKNIIKGRNNEKFAPDELLTRAEISTIIARILNLENTEIQELTRTYIDIKGHWAEESIYKISELDIVNGYTDGTFKPNESVTRAESAKIIYKALEYMDNKLNKNDFNTLEQNGENTIFDDISGKFWANEYINKLSNIGIINGYEDKTFKPDKKITRAEIAQIIYKALIP